MNKCKDCVNKNGCPYKNARRCKGDPLYNYLPKSFYQEKEYINQWEEKDGMC